jgi:biopolymer transport protein ExbD
MAANAAAGVAIKPDIMKPIIDAESGAVGGVTQTKLPPAAQSPLPVSYDPRGPMYGDQNAVSDQELMQFAQTMHPDNRYFFLNSDRATQVQSYLQAMGY